MWVSVRLHTYAILRLKKIILHLLGRRLHAQQSGSGGGEEEKKSVLLPRDLISCSIASSTVIILY